MRRAKLLWTAHNLMPHDATPFPHLDRLGRKIVIALSDRVFVHGSSAARIVAEQFPGARRKLTVIHHGHWLDFYARSQSRAEARAQLGLPGDAHVFLFIGLCKPYKNLEGLIETFRRRSGALLLLIAGAFQKDDYRQRIGALAAGDERIRLYPRYIPDAELQTFLGACDCVVLPYVDTLTSGAAMLALSFGRPVVSVKRGSLQDVITDEVGILYEPKETDGFERALQAAVERRFDEARILAHARRFSWAAAAEAFVDALQP
jgi:glycosyltransferase involved in cell wall biosynthesis